MKYKRFTEVDRLKSGSGNTDYDSKLFSVTKWRYYTDAGFISLTEIRATIGSERYSVYLEGICNILSDAECIQYFTPEGLLSILKEVHLQGIEEGKQQKLDEIKKCFLIA